LGYGLVNLLADVITWWGLLLTSSNFSFNYLGGYMDKEEIKALRTKMKLTQKQLADTLGVDTGTVSRWERGEKRPSQLARRQLARLQKKALK